MSQSTSNKEINRVIRDLVQNGWVVEIGRSRHIRIRSPGGKLITASRSPSCPHAAKNFKADALRIMEEEHDMQII